MTTIREMTEDLKYANDNLKLAMAALQEARRVQRKMFENLRETNAKLAEQRRLRLKVVDGQKDNH